MFIYHCRGLYTGHFLLRVESTARTVPNMGRIGQPSVLNNFLIDFRHLAPFRNQGDSKATGIEIEAIFRTFLHLVKFRGEISVFFRVRPIGLYYELTEKPLTFDGSPLGGLGGWSPCAKTENMGQQ